MNFRKLLLLALAIGCIPSYALAHKLSGHICNEQAEPLAYSTISINDGENGVIADAEGNFSIPNLKAGEYILNISYLGYSTLKKTIEITGNDQPLRITLSKTDTDLQEVNIVADKYAREVKINSISAVKVDHQFITENAAASLMQTLSKVPGVSSIDMGASASKPIIRGMSFNRVAVVNSGIKLEGQQWGETHGLELDQYAIENVKIIKGPASIMYGSDALAGVIEIMPTNLPAPNSTSGELKAVGKSNNDLLGSSFLIKQRKEDYFYNLRMTYLDYGDFRVPKDWFEYNTYNLHLNYRAKNTAGKEAAVCSEFGKIFDKGSTTFMVSNLYRKSGFYADAFGVEIRTQIPVDHAKSQRDIQIPNQLVNHFRASNQTIINFDANTKLTANAAYQTNTHTDYEHLSDKYGVSKVLPEDHISTRLKLQTFSGNVKYKKKLDKTELSSGLSAQYIDNKRSGFNFNIPTYQKMITGGYVLYRKQLKEKSYFDAGVRYDYGMMDIEGYIHPRNPELILSKDTHKAFQSITGNIGYTGQLSENIHAKASLGKSFRIASIRELSANGMIFSAARYEIGNQNLNPEEVYQLDGEINYTHPVIDFTIAGFYSYFSHYIFANPTGDFNNDVGAGQVYNYQETEAIRTGGEIYTTIKPHRSIDFNVLMEYVFVENLRNNTPLPFTPPMSIDASVDYKLNGTRIKAYNLKTFTGVKHLTGQNRTVPNEVPGGTTQAYSIVYLGASGKFSKGINAPSFNFRIDNLFNSEYYNHLSIYRRINMPEAGINIQLTITIPFGNR